MGKKPEKVPVLDLASLPERFPNAGRALLTSHVPHAITRLRGPVAGESPEAKVTVEWIDRQKRKVVLTLVMSWVNVEVWEGYCEQIQNIENDSDLTEKAAIVAMALLMSELESMDSISSNPIGSGADYWFTMKTNNKVAVEVSGINIVSENNTPQQRIRKKTQQLFVHHEEGYVSVTAFQCPDGSKQSYLHFVSRSSRPDKRHKKSMITKYDNQVECSNLSMEGGAATLWGETNKASELHNRAGELFMKEADAADTVADQHFIHLLAATQFFLAGNYSRARSVSAAIKRTKIPERYRRALRGLVATAHDRARADYVPRIRQKAVEEWKKHDYRAVMKLLAEHPYVYPQDVMAYIRSVVGAELGQYAASAQYMKQSLKLGLKDQEYLFQLMCLPLVPLKRGNLDVAWVHAQKAMTILPHAGTYLIGVFVLHQMAWKANGSGQNEWIPKLLECDETMEKLLPDAPEDFRTNRHVRDFLELTREMVSIYKSRSGGDQSIQDVIPSELQARYNNVLSRSALTLESVNGARLAS